MNFRHLLAFLPLLASPLLAADAPKLTPAETEFFETRVRPVLAEHCYKCHSAGAEKIKGSLLLDTRDGVRKGGETGPAIIPGKPDESLLIKAVRYTDKDFAMPPGDKKLPENFIRDLEQWVKMGAPDPRTEATSAKGNYAADLEAAKKHWAYKPVVKPGVPAPEDASGWAANDVDKFILAAMQTKKLSPSPRADKVTLLRRATFDLHGLPPAEKELSDFLADNSPDAFAKVLERLLASPRYGERWGRHWLDLTKYADTKGRSEQGRDNRYLYSHTYRDWVIRALNEDMPYDQFLLRQIAGDQLKLADQRDLAALGFLTLGARFNNNANDIIDDRIDLLGKSTMGLTLACARCHDHKFDPISTKDYYSLHGVFSSSTEPREGPLLEAPEDSPAYREFLKQLNARAAALSNFVDGIERELGAETRGKAADYLLALAEFKRMTNGPSRNDYMQRRGLRGSVAEAWSNYLKTRAGKPHPVWTPWFAFSALDEKDFPTKGKELALKFAANLDAKNRINTHVAKLFATAPASLAQVAARYDTLFNNVSKQWEGIMATYEARRRATTTPGPEPTALPDPATEEVRHVLYAKSSPAFLDERAVQNFIQRDDNTRNSYNALQRALNDVKASHPASPGRAHALADAEKPKDSYVMIKGNPGNRGPVVPRQAPAIIAGAARQPFQKGSGRLELGQAIASKDNPLTARVMANRIWLHHFGAGLVATPDDFGLRSDPPTHPELLDYLAVRFMADGWSLKKMHRLLMLSATWQQSGEETARFNQIDPDNRYYWQMNRRRLDFESLRDTILYIGGRLDLQMGGPGVRLDAEPYPVRRSVYGYIDRSRVPNMQLAFDFANPDLTTGRRNTTIVPQQALFMMNSPLVVEQARNLTLRPDFKARAQAEDKIKLLYKIIYQRAPSEVEMRLALDYVRGEASVTAANSGALAWEYGFGEPDAGAKRMKSFVQLPSFNGNAWVVGNRQAKAGPVALTAKGGRPGNGTAHGAVRRWTARRDGFISIDGALGQQSKDATEVVRGWIISSGLGLVGTYAPQKNVLPTKLPRVLVKRGDTIDFVVAGKGGFTWAPTVKFLEGGKAGEVAEWNAEKDFSGAVAPKHLEAWEKLAQVLLETNEMIFVN